MRKSPKTAKNASTKKERIELYLVGNQRFCLYGH